MTAISFLSIPFIRNKKKIYTIIENIIVINTFKMPYGLIKRMSTDIKIDAVMLLMIKITSKSNLKILL